MEAIYTETVCRGNTNLVVPLFFANGQYIPMGYLDQLTRRGACGKQWVSIEGEGSYLRNVECTKDDLRK